MLVPPAALPGGARFSQPIVCQIAKKSLKFGESFRSSAISEMDSDNRVTIKDTKTRLRQQRPPADTPETEEGEGL